MTYKMASLSVRHENNIDVMGMVLKANTDSGDDFPNILLNYDNSQVVEVASDRFLGCGLTNAENAMTIHSDFRYQNMNLGKLMKPRSEVRESINS